MLPTVCMRAASKACVLQFSPLSVHAAAAPKPRKVSAKREESRLKKQESERRKESARLCREAAST
jgi:hypothetical protein